MRVELWGWLLCLSAAWATSGCHFGEDDDDLGPADGMEVGVELDMAADAADVTDADVADAADAAGAADAADAADVTVADGGCAPVGEAAPIEPPVAVADLPVGAVTDHGCSMDVFFVETPLSEPSPGPGWSGRFVPTLAGLDPSWFCAAGDGACFAEVGRRIELGDFAAVAPLIPVGTAHAGEAPERFFRVRLFRPVLPEALSALVNALRAFAGQAARDQVRFFVGRECAAIALGNEPVATAALRERALMRIGAALQPLGHPVMPVADVVLVDSGVQSLEARRLGVSILDLPGEGAPEGDAHPHGTAMAVLVRQITDRARLHSARVLGSDGVGAIGDVARGVIAALDVAAADPARALVINLSVGWPPELGLRRGAEDPVGEAVRYALLQARAAAAADRPVVVISAAGNRPGRAVANAAIYPKWFGVEPGAEPPTGCLGPVEVPEAPRQFFPAEWSRVPTCAFGQMEATRLTWSIGAVGPGDAPARVAIQGADPALVAPGEHVYVDTGFSAGTPGPACGALGVTDLTFTAPTAITGTSAAAALTSGSVAALFAAWRDGGELLPGSDVVQHLMIGAGTTLQRAPDSRLLSTCRALAGLGCTLQRCLMERDTAGAISPDVAMICRQELDGCEPAMRCPRPSPPPPLPDGFELAPAAVCQCSAAPDTPAQDDGCATADQLCPYELGIDLHSRGFAGPQPSIPSCPECLARVRQNKGTVDLHLAFDHKLDANATVDKGYLVLDTAGGIFWRILDDTSALEDWVAGDAILIEGVSLPADAISGCLQQCEAELITYLLSPTGATSKITVPLRVKLDP